MAPQVHFDYPEEERYVPQDEQIQQMIELTRTLEEIRLQNIETINQLQHQLVHHQEEQDRRLQLQDEQNVATEKRKALEAERKVLKEERRVLIEKRKFLESERKLQDEKLRLEQEWKNLKEEKMQFNEDIAHEKQILEDERKILEEERKELDEDRKKLEEEKKQFAYRSRTVWSPKLHQWAREEYFYHPSTARMLSRPKNKEPSTTVQTVNMPPKPKSEAPAETAEVTCKRSLLFLLELLKKTSPTMEWVYKMKPNFPMFLGKDETPVLISLLDKKAEHEPQIKERLIKIISCCLEEHVVDIQCLSEKLNRTLNNWDKELTGAFNMFMPSSHQIEFDTFWFELKKANHLLAQLCREQNNLRNKANI